MSSTELATGTASDARRSRPKRFLRLRAVGRWALRGLLGILALLLLTALTGTVYESVARSRGARRYPAPGKLVDIGTHRLHIHCTGQGSPMVLLDAGAAAWSNSWWWVQRDLSATTRTCSYDRAGFGWSDPGPAGSMDGIQTAKELHALLEKAGEPGPFVYVGHSLGGMQARIYYDLYPHELAGMVLVDPGDPQILLDDTPALRRPEIRPCGRICTYGRIASNLGIVRFFIHRNTLLNDPKFPQPALAEYKSRAVLPEVLTSFLSFGRYLGSTCRETLQNKSLGDLPLVVVHSTEFVPPFFVTANEEEHRQAVKQYMDAWTAITGLSTKGRPMVAVEGSNHLTIITYKEYAGQVSAAIQNMVTSLRKAPPRAALQK